MSANLMDKIIALCKQRGFVFQGSEIYGGLANTWDYGPLGIALKNNIQQAWWKYFVQNRLDMVGLDASILMNPKVWEASGHIENFNDAMVDCRNCHTRFRADHLIENSVEGLKVEGLSPIDLDKLITENNIKCPKCGNKDFTNTRVFNLLFKTFIGPISNNNTPVYLRGELAQSMFTNFRNILNTSRKKIPFGIAQIGKVFRNEITPGNFIFRTLEFDLMEFEYFINEKDWKSTFKYWLQEMQNWIEYIGLDQSLTRIREHGQDELSHYSKKTIDIEFNTPFGWKELYGLAYRTNFDLKNHSEKSGIDLSYLDPYTKERFIPHIIEPTFGLTRTLLMVLLSSYHEEKIESTNEEGDSRVVLKLKSFLAPYQIAILPLSNKLSKPTEKLTQTLIKNFRTDYDVSGSIGKRYRRQDEIGTPFCITYDFDSEQDKSVTVRDRDTMKQERVKTNELDTYLNLKFKLI